VTDEQLRAAGWEYPPLDTTWVCPKCWALVPKTRTEDHTKWHLVNSIGFG
jgi:rubredoxin